MSDQMHCFLETIGGIALMAIFAYVWVNYIESINTLQYGLGGFLIVVAVIEGYIENRITTTI